MRALLRFVLQSLVRLYFPVIELEGRSRLPHSGGVIFVLNHPNGLLDPAVLRIAVRRPVGFLAKSTLFRNPLGKLAMEAFDAIPVFRQQDVVRGGGDTSQNDKTFALCRAVLARGGAIALFPEGTSHSDPQMKPLKTGAARIALSAEREHEGKLGITVVPVGLAYEDKAIFRSRALVIVGDALPVHHFYDEYMKNEKVAVDALTDVIRHLLDDVVLQAESRELLDGVARVAMWTAASPGIRQDMAEHNRRARDLLDAHRSLQQSDPERAQSVVAAARSYAETLRSIGVNDPWSLEIGSGGMGRTVLAVAKLALLFPFAVIGTLLGWLPYRFTGLLSKRVTSEADVLGTVKLLGGALFVLLGWLIEAIAVSILVSPTWGALLLLIAPFTGYAALRFDEALEVAIASLRHSWIRHRSPKLAHELGERRRALAQEIAEALKRA